MLTRRSVEHRGDAADRSTRTDEPTHGVSDEVAYLIHDLKNPVNAIELLAETVLRDPEGSDRGRAAAAKICAETRAMARMITSLLDIGRAGDHRLVAVRRDVDPRVLVADVVAEQRAAADAAGVALVANVKLAACRVDPDLLQRVLANLVDNAIRYAPEATQVELAIRSLTCGVEVRVSDGGPGIPVALRQAVFERFVRGDAGATRSNRGLGLTFCKLAVEAHGGRIWIEDRDPGSAFCLWIPDEDPRSDPPVRDEHGAASMAWPH